MRITLGVVALVLALTSCSQPVAEVPEVAEVEDADTPDGQFLDALAAEPRFLTLRATDADLLDIGYDSCEALENKSGDGLKAMSRVMADRYLSGESLGREGAFNSVIFYGWYYLCPEQNLDEEWATTRDRIVEGG